MGAGLGLLQLSPADFWAMTPKELAAAVRGLLGEDLNAVPPGRNALAGLMQRFPDEKD